MRCPGNCLESSASLSRSLCTQSAKPTEWEARDPASSASTLMATCYEGNALQRGRGSPSDSFLLPQGSLPHLRVLSILRLQQSLAILQPPLESFLLCPFCPPDCALGLLLPALPYWDEHSPQKDRVRNGPWTVCRDLFQCSCWQTLPVAHQEGCVSVRRLQCCSLTLNLLGMAAAATK